MTTKVVRQLELNGRSAAWGKSSFKPVRLKLGVETSTGRAVLEMRSARGSAFAPIEMQLDPDDATAIAQGLLELVAIIRRTA